MDKMDSNYLTGQGEGGMMAERNIVIHLNPFEEVLWQKKMIVAVKHLK